MEQKNVIILRYGELHLKGKNRGYFERVLKNNISEKIKAYNATVEIISGRYVVAGFSDNNKSKVIELLTKTAGLHSISPAIEIDTDQKDIEELCVALMLNQRGSFKVETTRADKRFPIVSMEFSALIGEKILDVNKNLKVNLHKPDITLHVELRENSKTYIYFEEIKAVGGMPVSTSGKGLLLLSGGIDSPVAGYMMIKRGMRIIGLHFESFPYTSPQAKEKVIELAGILKEYNGMFSLYVANIAEIQESIHKNCHPDYMITLVRRFMLRIADKLAKEKDIDAIITGESLAQVASQTIESMTVIGEALKSNKPLLKPLIAFDKEETIEISRKIGAFDISIKPYDDCCTVFLPESPVIKPRLDKVLKEEEKLDVDALINSCFEKIEKIEI